MRINLLAPWRIQLRNHRKLLVVDGRIGFIGGINISSENVRRHTSLREEYIHDLHCKVLGPAVGELQLSFMRDWSFAAKMPPSEIFTGEYFPSIDECGNSIMRVVYTGPGQNPSASEKVFFTAASTAKKYIWIMTPYFVPDKPFIRAVKMAEARGVDVRVIVPKNNNHWYVDYACKSLYRTLLESGVRIFEKTGTFSHVKAMIVDGEWGQMGSSNCDVRSFKLNFELDFAVYCGEFMRDLHAQFEEELEESEEVFLSSVLRKKKHVELVENLCSLLTPVL
jgi:cardiolipin synthase